MEPIVLNYGGKIISEILRGKGVFDAVSSPNFFEGRMGRLQSLLTAHSKTFTLQPKVHYQYDPVIFSFFRDEPDVVRHMLEEQVKLGGLPDAEEALHLQEIHPQLGEVILPRVPGEQPKGGVHYCSEGAQVGAQREEVVR